MNKRLRKKQLNSQRAELQKNLNAIKEANDYLKKLGVYSIGRSFESDFRCQLDTKELAQFSKRFNFPRNVFKKFDDEYCESGILMNEFYFFSLDEIGGDENVTR